jgi:hypothetical protein
VIDDIRLAGHGDRPHQLPGDENWNRAAVRFRRGVIDRKIPGFMA